MSQELATVPETSAVATALSIIARAAADPTVDIAKMHALLDLQERMMKLEREAQFNQAMARLQPKLPTIAKNGRIEIPAKGIVQKFARYEDIDKLVRPLMNEEGFSIAFNSECIEKGFVITGTLSHVGGHSRTATIPLALETSGSKNTVQAMGSTISYGKRYALTMLLNIVTRDEDDNAQSAGAIDADQVNKIRDMLLHSGANQAKFLEWLKVPEVESISVKDFDRAMAALKAKAEAKGNA